MNPKVSKFRTTDPSGQVTIFRDADDKWKSITVPAFMKSIVDNYGSHPALVYLDEISREWVPVTYKDYHDRVVKMAKVFIKLGLERHGSVAVLAFNSVEWFVSELAAIHAGGIIAGVYTTNSVDACFHILETSKANIAIVDEPKQMEKIREIKDKLPHLKAIVQTLPPYAQYMKQDDGYWRWSELEEIDTDDVEKEYKKRLTDIATNECCCLIYTSGTVGKSKGVMLSHDNITFIARRSVDFLELQTVDERFVSYLPLSHIAAQVVEIFFPMTCAGTVYFADRDAIKGTLSKTLAVADPTFFFGVPRVYEKMQEQMVAVGAQCNALTNFVSSWAKRVTLQHNLNCMTQPEYPESLQYKLARSLFISEMKRQLGISKCRIFVTGAAPMRPETKKYFMSLDIVIRDTFGMSEVTGPHCFCPRTFHSLETAGIALTGSILTKISDPDEDGNGEICVKGRHVFMGYLRDLEKTIDAFDADGWLRTGDVGRMDADGFLYITGRIKELIITAGGENIPPVLIETNVKNECAAISNALVVGDKRKFLTILVTLKTVMNSKGEPSDKLTSESLEWLEGLGLSYTRLSEVLAAGPDPKVLQCIQEAINRANKFSISNAQKIQKFAILPHDFSIPTGELGPTMKLKRNVVVEKYSEIIETFYK